MAEEAAPGIDVDALVEAERTQAEKFGVEYREPGQKSQFKNEARKQKVGPNRGFTTGFDMFAEEEVEKRNQRAERFNMPGKGLEWSAPEVAEDEEKKKARAERFGVDYKAPDETGLMDVDLFEERMDAPLEVDRRPDAVHIYGVDLMSTGDVLKYFTDYGPTFVEWINDSSANVLFSDADTAKRAIAGMGKPLSAEELPEGAELMDAANIEYLWHKGEDFVKSGTNIPLIFRMATILDVKPSEKAQSRRLWLTAGREKNAKDRRSSGKKNYKVRKSGEGQQAYRRRPPPGWEHDDRLFDDFKSGDGEGRGRGQRHYKRKSDAGDTVMKDAGTGGKKPRRRSKGNKKSQSPQPGAQPQQGGGSAAPMPERETISYDDL